MIRALQLALVSGAALALPLTASAHGSEFLTAKVLLLRDGGARLEVTADYGDNPMIADEAAAGNAITHALQWKLGTAEAKLPAAPRLERRNQPDPSSPVPSDPLYNNQQHTLLTGIWHVEPSAAPIFFQVPQGSSQSVVLWMQHESQPDEKPRWVMLVSGDESPAIVFARPVENKPRNWMPAGLAGLCLILGIVLLRRPRLVTRTA